MKLITALVLLLTPVGTIPAEARGGNWRQWRGPEASGVSRTAKPPLEWNEERNIRWKTAIDGNGSSSPIVWSDKVFLLTAIDTREVDPSLPKPEDQPKRMFDITNPNTVFEFVVPLPQSRVRKGALAKDRDAENPARGDARRQ